jgi:hypothetical protein
MIYTTYYFNITIYFNFLGQYDVKGYVSLNATNIGAIVLLFIGIIISYSAKIKNLSHFETKNPQEKQTSPSIIEQAISTLILDYVKEREFERDNLKNAQHQKEQIFEQNDIRIQ